MSYPYHRTTNAEYDDKEGGLTLETISSLLSRLEAGMLVVKLWTRDYHQNMGPK